MTAMLVMACCHMEEEKHKSITRFKYYELCCFILSIQFLMLWKQVEMNNWRNMLGSFIIQVGTGSSISLNWFFSLYIQRFVSSYPNHQKRTNLETHPLLLRFIEHSTLTSISQGWHHQANPFHHLNGWLILVTLVRPG